MAQVQQGLRVYLKSGQNIEMMFAVQENNELNKPIQQFIEALSKKEKQDEFFAFSGKRLIVIRLSDVAAVEAISLERKQEPVKAAQPQEQK